MEDYIMKANMRVKDKKNVHMKEKEHMLEKKFIFNFQSILCKCIYPN